MKLYVVHSNECLPSESSICKIELVTNDLEAAKKKYRECIETWYKERSGSEKYETETDTTTIGEKEVETYFSAYINGYYPEDHYDVMIEVVEPIMIS